MFAPFSTFPLPNVRPEPEGDHLMDWVGWRGKGFIALTPVNESLVPPPIGEDDEILLFRPRPARKKKKH